MGFLGESSTAVGVGFLLTLCFAVIFLIGFATPFWIKSGVFHSGLWQSCSNSVCHAIQSGILTDHDKAVQAMECLALISLFVAVVCILLKRLGKAHGTKLYKFIAFCLFFAAITDSIGVILYAATDRLVSSNLHFSFAFCVISSIGVFIAGLLILIGKQI